MRGSPTYEEFKPEGERCVRWWCGFGYKEIFSKSHCLTYVNAIAVSQDFCSH